MRRAERISQLHRALLTGTPSLDVHGWSKHFRVNPRTIQRDLSYIREHLGFDIAFDRKFQGYRYRHPDTVKKCLAANQPPLDLGLSPRMTKTRSRSEYPQNLARRESVVQVHLTLDCKLIEVLEKCSFHQGLTAHGKEVTLACIDQAALAGWVLAHPGVKAHFPGEVVALVRDFALQALKNHLESPGDLMVLFPEQRKNLQNDIFCQRAQIGEDK